jgi:hypothetical protein
MLQTACVSKPENMKAELVLHCLAAVEVAVRKEQRNAHKSPQTGRPGSFTCTSEEYILAGNWEESNITSMELFENLMFFAATGYWVVT